MPALVNKSVGSFAGTSDEECTSLCPFCTKKSRNLRRISEPVSMEKLILNDYRASAPLRAASGHRGRVGKSAGERKGRAEFLRGPLNLWRRPLLHRVCGLLPRFLHLMPRSLGTLLDAAAGLLGDFLCAFCGVFGCYFGFVAGLLSALLCGGAGFIGRLLRAMGLLCGGFLWFFARVLGPFLHVGC